MTSEPGATPDDELRRATFAEIDLDKLTANYRAIDDAVGTARVLPVLKANAYGHGLVEIARHLEPLGPAGFGVAILEEGILLRSSGISAPILVMGSPQEAQISHFLKHDLTMTASSDSILRQINRLAREMGTKARVHLKVDTGMGRIGTSPQTAGSMFETGLAADNVDIEAVYSHFATADEADRSGTERQLDRFLGAVSFYANRDIPTPELHIANSGGILGFPQSHLDLVRPGILLFGVYPSEDVAHTIDVSPILSWKSQVAFVKEQQAGDPVSYGSTWAPTNTTRVITIPAGYGDGYFRALSNKGEVIVGGKRCPIVGRICMDQFMVDIGPEGTALDGEEVVMMGVQGTSTVSAEDIAGWADTIPYEVLSNINTRVARVYIGSVAGEPR